jgi:putative FmdB family regulatory protein
MPIYAYACGACGFKRDVLQKLSDAPLTDCPSCGQPQFSKQLTAPGFVLKGSGWYVTDFREGQKKPAESAAGATSDTASSGSAGASDAAAPASASTAPSAGSTPAAPAAASAAPASPAPTATPAKAA